jgi:hypothetical protein
MDTHLTPPKKLTRPPDIKKPASNLNEMTHLTRSKMEINIARLKRDLAQAKLATEHHIKTLNHHADQLKVVQDNIAQRTNLKNAAVQRATELQERLEAMTKAKESIDSI